MSLTPDSSTYQPTLLEAFFSRQGVRLPGSHLLVAYSGGLDSTVLAASMTELAGRHAFRVTLAHVNHHLRAESDGEEAFCRDFAAGMGLPFCAVSLDPTGRAGESIEAWARRERYAALERMAAEVDARWVLTAHHADDQAETVLMRLNQQAPLLSLAGIRPSRGRLLRPLLPFTRRQLKQWAVAQGLKWVDDPSNTDMSFLRNRLRHGMLKRIVAGDPTATATLLGLARMAQSYEALCAQIAREVMGQARSGALTGTFTLPVAALLPVEDDIFKLTVRGCLQRYWGSAGQVSRHHWQNFRHFVRVGRVGKVFDLLPAVRVLMDRQELIFYPPERESGPEQCSLKVGRTQWGSHNFLVVSGDSRARVTGLFLRPWRAGDRVRFRPENRPKRISDIFINARLSRLEKNHWPLVVTAHNEIIWVPGLMEPRSSMQVEQWNVTWRR